MTLKGRIQNGIVMFDEPVSLPNGSQVEVRTVSAGGAGDDVERRFQELTRQWKEATQVTSSITEVSAHPAYQQIIGMGKDAVPLILAELRREPDHWFWALRAITGEDPVPAADRGKLQAMTRAWLDWADRRGLAPG